MLSGCKSPLLRHVVSHRRQVHMILNNKAEEFNYQFIVRVDDFDYTLFATSSALKCFNCREEGHLARACPSRVAPDAPAAEQPSWPVPAARRRWLSAEGSPAAPDGAVTESWGGEKRDKCAHESEVSGGSEIVEMVVEMNGESGESRGKVDLTEVVSDLSGVMIDGVCDLNELGQNGEVMGETVKMGEAGETRDTIQTGKLGGVSQVMGELGVPGIAAGELGEEAVSTGELGEEAVSTGERGEGAVSTCEGGEGVVSTGDGAVSAGEGASGMSEWWLVPAKRRNKHKCAMKDKGDSKTGRLEDATDGTDTSDCESMSDCSSLSGTMPDGHENNLYPPSMLKNFLTQTKGMKGLNLEKHFPDMLLFVQGFTPSSLEVEHVTGTMQIPIQPRFCHCLRQLAYSHGLVDVWRRMHTDSRQYTWSRLREGQKLVEPGQIRQRTVEFFSSMYESEYCRDDGLFDEFCGDLPRVSEEANSRLDRPLQLDELHAALLSMKGRKSPGVDGLTVEFFKAFWDIVSHDMLEGNLQKIKNWRPVSLLCMDYRILSKTLASRLREAMEQVIHRDQTYHQEKAFDWVEHQFLWKVMERFGFSPGFLAMIRVLYCDIVSMLKFNGSLFAPFRVRRGVRQGCALSGVLYALSLPASVDGLFLPSF
ncbi:Transposon TX1 uncharacterized 149 kDa protein ORF 2 [Takifugu flavidus]|uniref:Transposon TX1 uncharacterized 149 kDa protein ORF 2 n=1 Tax=Takifugu flavidus TaxID=433684 RepID=A0A5C6MML4_9TELE|nr:Transposon TX1 uncharacterized 149 kDa protein ORF 2 [Takifugu flavidus]